MNDQTIPQFQVISLFLRKYFRFNYQLLWSPQHQLAFTAIPNFFTPNENLPFIINEQNEHPYFFRPDAIMQHNIDRINFESHLITDNNIIDDNRPYHYQRNTPVQQNPPIIFDNDDRDNGTNNEDLLQQQEIYNENIPQQQHENLSKILDLSEFQLELSVKPKIHLILNLIKIHFKIETSLLTFHFTQMKIHKTKLKT